MNYQVPEADKAAVLEVLQAWDGTYEAEAGHVLSDIALLTGVHYKMVSRTVLALEQQGDVIVDRVAHVEARRANRLIRISINTEPRF